MTLNELENKALGMLIGGAIGDALGAAGEFHGPHSISLIDELKPAGSNHINNEAVLTDRIGQEWAIWDSSVTNDTIGVITDDTSFRLTLLHPWLLTEASRSLSEESFRSWIENAPSPLPSWEQAYLRQIEQWKLMWFQAESYKTDPDNFNVDSSNEFYRPTKPIIFGMFMFLEAGFITPSVTTILDTEQRAKDATYFWQRVMNDVVENTSGDLPGIINDTLSEIKENLSPEIAGSIIWGLKRGTVFREQNLSEDEAVSFLNDSAFTWEKHVEFGFFFSPLFTRAMAFAAAYAKEDCNKALRVLSACPGDSDTMPSFLGSIYGGLLGPDVFRESWRTPVRNYIETTYAINLEEIAHQLAIIRDEATLA